MSTAQDALKDFDSTGNSSEVKPQSYSATPSIRLHDADGENVGQFIIGKYLGRREAQGPNGKLVFLDIVLEKTNARASVKKNDKFIDVEAKAGDMISLFAPSRLDRAISSVEAGTVIFASYDGMKKVQTKKGRVFAHTFTVKRKPGQLSTEEREYVNRTKQSQASKEDAEQTKATSEAEAEAALSALED